MGNNIHTWMETRFNKFSQNDQTASKLIQMSCFAKSLKLNVFVFVWKVRLQWRFRIILLT